MLDPRSVAQPASGKTKIEAPVKYKPNLLNLLGKEFLSNLVPTLESALTEKDMIEVSLSSAQTLLAVKCFQSAQGRLPESLSELVPDYLKEVPRDPFDGQPLRYSAEKRILYSVGDDLEDGGGSKEVDRDKARWDRKEPTVKIEL